MYVHCLIIYCLLYLVNAKLTRKTVEDKNAAIETVRVITASKNEDTKQDRDYVTFHTETIRNPRDINKPTEKTNVTTLETIAKHQQQKVALVKKPIPKFTDNGSDEDYQAKMKFPNRVADSVEHEDEDFSVGDYDFDVNHDEFVGRGKPLEPRTKVNVRRQKVQQPLPVATLRQSKAKILHNEGKPSAKVARKAVTDVMKEEEYDEEFSAITKPSEKHRKSFTAKDVTSSFSEEIEDSGEEEIKRPMRAARSSSPLSFGTYVDKMGEIPSEFVTKMLTYLPLFPHRYSSPEKVNDVVIAENAPTTDPWLTSSVSD